VALPAYTARPPAALIVCKIALAALLVTGTVAPDVGGFAGKGMGYRLVVFMIPALVVPVMWRRRRGMYAAALDAALTVPFLLDTAANAVGLYDSLDATDDILHFVNWLVLIAGITATITAHTPGASRWLQTLAGTGVGAMAIIGWEIAEYGVMEAGVGNLSLTYGDTLGDLALSTAGGAIGAILSHRVWRPDRSGAVRPAPAPSAVLEPPNPSSAPNR
jgi:hypothetical protein